MQYSLEKRMASTSRSPPLGRPHDHGRAINNFEPGWPETLTGFARRAFEFYQNELEPQGYKLRAQVLEFPGGVPGDIGIFLRW